MAVFLWGNITDRNFDKILYCPHQERKGTFGVFDMRGMWVIFCGLCVCGTSTAATFSAVKVPLCGYGYYRYGSECRPVDIQADKCSAINGQSTSRVYHDSTSFMYQEHSDLKCLGMYDLYTYNQDLFAPEFSTGTLRSFGPPMCGYGYYRLNNKCYKKTDSDAVGLCPENFHKTGSDSASYMSLFVQGDSCLGLYGLYEYADYLHPLYNGILVSVGAPLQTASDMRGTPCSINSDNYYQIAVATEDAFAHPDVGLCSPTSAKFVVNTDCKDIDASDANSLRQNAVCGVLCDSGVYTNSGICANSYCMNGDKTRRLYYQYGNTKHSIPLYSNSTTTPSLNVKYDNGQICYMNLVTGGRTGGVRVKHENVVYYGID